MSDATWIALAGFVLSGCVALITAAMGVRKLNETLKKEIDKQLDYIKRELHDAELGGERRMGEMGEALREKISQVEFHVRDNFVDKEIFNKMIDMAAANNEYQFRALNEAVSRIHDKLDTMQADRYHRSQV